MFVLLGISWTAVTAAAMFALATGKARTGKALGNPVLITEGRVTLVDGMRGGPRRPPELNPARGTLFRLS